MAATEDPDRERETSPSTTPEANPDLTQPILPSNSAPASAASQPDTTQAMPPPPIDDPDRTQAVPAPAAKITPEPTVELTQQEQDRRLAADLARRGVPPDEIERLIALGRGEPVAPPKRAAASMPPAPPTIPPSEPYVPKPTITLPDFREATTQQRIEADRILTTANIARRRGNFREAEKACREAIDLVPKDAAALELYGDVLQSVGRVDDALYVYGRAKEADPSRRSAEKKYAELMLLQNREIELLREEYLPRNPNVAVLLSALFPGAGQLYNGDTIKGLMIALILLGCVGILGWTPYGFPGAQHGITGSLVLFTLAFAIAYIYAVVDANLSARRGKRPKSGWEV